MITISKKSQIYKYVDHSIPALMHDERNPTNLCPFMRRFFFYFLFECFLAFAFTFAIFLPMVAAIVNLFLPGFFEIVFVGIGWFLWGLIFVITSVYLIQRYGGERVVATAKRVAALDSTQTVYAWLHTVHDKICPEVQYKE